MDLANHDIRYIGCLKVKTSMRSLAHRIRSEVAKESIKRLCHANCHNGDFEKKYQDNIHQMLANEPNLENAGASVRLNVTSTHLNVISKDTGEIIIQHEMPNVSFASSGDEDVADFVAYVAKDSKFERSCFVFKCGHEIAKIVLEYIARGFNERSQQLLCNNGTLSKTSNGITNKNCNTISTKTIDTADKFTVDLNNPNVHNHNANNENHKRKENAIRLTRASLRGEPWYHGPIDRTESESRLEHDGDFLVREEDGDFVLSVMHDGKDVHILFDSMNQIKTKSMEFKSIKHYIFFLLEQEIPIMTPDRRVVYLRNGISPPLTRA